MVTHDRDKLLSGFRKKGFKTEEGQKHIILFFMHNGRKTPFKTHFSRGEHGRKVNDYLIDQMAKQLKITRDQFLGIPGCKYDDKDYIVFVKEHLGTQDPLDLL